VRLQFILGEIGGGLRRNLSMVVSVILVTFVSLTFVGAAGMLQLQINQMKGYWYDKVQVAIFLCGEGSTAAGCASGPVTAEQQDNVRTLLESPAVAQYINGFQFESKDDAYKHFKEQFSNSPIVDSVTPDQLPASFRINMKDPEKYQIISETFASQPGVETVIDQRQVLERLFSVMNAASLVAVIIAGVMTVCAILLIATTIRLSAFSRRRETGDHAARGSVKDSDPAALHPRRRDRRGHRRRPRVRNAVGRCPLLPGRIPVQAISGHSVHLAGTDPAPRPGPRRAGCCSGGHFISAHAPPILEGVGHAHRRNANDEFRQAHAKEPSGAPAQDSQCRSGTDAGREPGCVSTGRLRGRP
jgi:cell division transport system permease protein